MANITLRQANVVTSTGGTVKGSPLTNAEVDNNFANLNVEVNDTTANIVGITFDVSNVSSNIGDLGLLDTTATNNVVVAINEVRASIVDPIPFSIALG